jgi:hypothetical protein
MEVDVGVSALGEPPRLGQCGGGKIQAGHPSAQAGKGQRVGTDVALQVHAAPPSQLAQPGRNAPRRSNSPDL